MNAKTHLEAAKALIQDPNKWCQGSDAQNENGDAVCAWAPTACKWCAVGALWKTGDAYGPARLLLEEVAKKEFGQPGPMSLNDAYSHNAVMRMFDHAISKANS